MTCESSKWKELWRELAYAATIRAIVAAQASAKDFNYCRLRRTRISPWPAGIGSRALPRIVPGRWNSTPERLTGCDFIAVPGSSPVTRRSPTEIGAFEASTRTLTRPTVAICDLSSLFLPRARPGCAETTPATRVSYDFCDGLTSLF